MQLLLYILKFNFKEVYLFACLLINFFNILMAVSPFFLFLVPPTTSSLPYPIYHLVHCFSSGRGRPPRDINQSCYITTFSSNPGQGNLEGGKVPNSRQQSQTQLLLPLLGAALQEGQVTEL